ncbi:MAG: PqqD family peptide modification chaperone [Dehalogenimonas sp.]
MKVLLIFPPQWVPFYPYLSLPSLSSYLQLNGIEVVQKDLNLETFDRLLTKDYISGLKERLETQFTIMNSRMTLSSGAEQRYYSDLFLAKSKVVQMASEVDEAKRILRDNQLAYNPRNLTKARNVMEQALAIISLAFFPTIIGLSQFRMPSFSGSVKDIGDIIDDKNVNPFTELYEHELIPSIQREEPDVIGISIVSGQNQLIPALTLSHKLMSLRKKPHVVVGGHAITTLADVIGKRQQLFTDFFDFAIVHEGEEPLLKLIQSLEHHLPLNDVPNLIYFRDSQIHLNDILPPLGIDKLPTPTFEGFDLNTYLSPDPILPVSSSRGCYWNKCAFCTHSLGNGSRYRKRNPTEVVNDVQKLSQKYGVTNFAFVDNCLSPKSIDQISTAVTERKMNVRFSGNIRFEKQFTRELCHKMAGAGFNLLYLGLESGCDRVLNLMNKGTQIDTAAKICSHLSDAGIWDHLYVMVGFPGEDRTEAQQTIDFLISHKNVIRSFHIENFQLAKGSQVYRLPEQYGILDISSGPNMDCSIVSDYSIKSGLTNMEAEYLKEYSMIKYGQEFEGNKIVSLIDNYLPLYLGHFKTTDPRLSSLLKLINAKGSNKPVNNISGNSVPRVSKHVILDQINYDLVAIQKNIKLGKTQTYTPVESLVIYNWRTNRLSTIDASVRDILQHCDGKSSIGEIAQKLAKSYKTPLKIVEKDCIGLFKSLLQRELISIR